MALEPLPAEKSQERFSYVLISSTSLPGVTFPLGYWFLISSVLPVEISLQKCFVVDNTVQVDNGWFFGTTTSFDTVPKPDARFEMIHWKTLARVTYLGSPEEKKEITRLGITCAPAGPDGQRPKLTVPAHPDGGGSSNSGAV